MKIHEIKCVDIKPLHDYVLDVTFNDGTSKKVSLKNKINTSRYFAVMKGDPFIFSQAYLDYGVVKWSDTLDIAPSYLYGLPEITDHASVV